MRQSVTISKTLIFSFLHGIKNYTKRLLIKPKNIVLAMAKPIPVLLDLTVYGRQSEPKNPTEFGAGYPIENVTHWYESGNANTAQK
jgi:hypothetical protein